MTSVQAVVLFKKIDLRVDPALRNVLFFRCFIGTVCLALQFYAVSQMVLTDAIVIMFTSPVFTFILVRVAIRELSAASHQPAQLYARAHCDCASPSAGSMGAE